MWILCLALQLLDKTKAPVQSAILDVLRSKYQDTLWGLLFQTVPTKATTKNRRVTESVYFLGSMDSKSKPRRAAVHLRKAIEKPCLFKSQLTKKKAITHGSIDQFSKVKQKLSLRFVSICPLVGLRDRHRGSFGCTCWLLSQLDVPRAQSVE